MDTSAIPIFDHHAHPIYLERPWREEPLERYFNLSHDPMLLRSFGRDNLYFRRSLRDLAEFYGCEPRLEAVLEARQAPDYLELCRWLFAEANLTHWLVDDGLEGDGLWTVEACGEHLPPVARRLLRLESEFAKLIPKHDTATKLLAAFDHHLRRAAPGVAGFKSVVAGRSGLEIARHNLVEIERAYSELRRSTQLEQSPLIRSKPLLDAMLWQALRVAQDNGKVVQFQAGLGGPDLDLRLANPLHLRGVLEAPDLRGVKIVLLHSYPFGREAGYLASLYPNVYLDVGLGIPRASTAGMQATLEEALHLAPVGKILFSTGGAYTPEVFWLAARWGRRALRKVLEQTVHDGDLTKAEAEWAALRILHDNAADLYGRGANPPTETAVEV
ncbi:MAG: amidohydrolase family protein [Meiothermus sp.]|nr:amidohydrolase family protein [Meiothermus sp.]